MLLKELDLNKLHVFAAVAEHGGVSRAAAELGRTPSAVSQSVTALEDALGVKLFDRIGKRLVLTRGGQLLHADVRRHHGGRLLPKRPAHRALARTPLRPSRPETDSRDLGRHGRFGTGLTTESRRRGRPAENRCRAVSSERKTESRPHAARRAHRLDLAER